MGRNEELAKNTLYFTIGSLGSKVIGFIMIPLYTKWMNPDEYGIVDLIQTYNQILLLIVGLGIAEALIVFPIKKTKEDVQKQFSTAVLFHLCFCLLFFVIYGGLYIIRLEFLNALNDIIWYAFFMLLSTTTSRLLQCFCRGLNRMKVFSLIGMIQALTVALFSILLIPKLSVKGYLIAIIASDVFTILFTLIYTKTYKYFSFFKFSKDVLLEMLKYSMPLIPNSLMWWLILALNRPLLERYHGVAMIGILAVANKLPTIIDMFYNFFHNSWIVTAVSEFNKDGFSKYYNQIFLFLVSFQTLICMIVVALSEYVFRLFIDSKYFDSIEYIPFMCFTVIISNIATFSTSIFNASKKTSYIFYSVIFATIISVFLNITLIPSFGIWGALISMFFAHFIAAISRILFARNTIKITCIGPIAKNISIGFIFCITAMMGNSFFRIITYVFLFSLWFWINIDECKYAKRIALERLKFHHIL